MNNEIPDKKKFEAIFGDDRDSYWLEDYIGFKPLTVFINEYMNYPDTKTRYDQRFSLQQDYGIHNRLDWLINQFMNELIVDKYRMQITGRSSYEVRIINKLKVRLH